MNEISKHQTTITAFDYSQLRPDQATQVQNLTEKIRTRYGNAVQQMLDVGAALNAVKELLDYGKFLPWLEAEFGWSERTAERYMKAARVFGDRSDTVSNLEATTIYQLAARSTPEPVRAQILAELEAGQRPAAKEIRGRIKKGRQEQARQKGRSKMSKKEGSTPNNPLLDQKNTHNCFEASAQAARMIADKMGLVDLDVLDVLKNAEPNHFISELLRILSKGRIL